MTNAPSSPLRLMGAPGSPYTRKMVATLRYRRIAHAILWGGFRNPYPGYPEPKVKLLPTFYFPTPEGGLEAVTDSTPITRRLEREHGGRSVLPVDPVLNFLNYLIEDYGDEWMTKAMFHYRWAHAPDAENAGPLLIFWSMPQMETEAAVAASQAISKRQIDRLYVVGSNDITGPTIEASFERFVTLFDRLIETQGYCLGQRPSSADFALYGQLTQLTQVEPTSMAAANAISRRVRAWVDRVEDLSGVEPEDGHWMSREAAREALAPLLAEIGRVYVPFLLANAAAVKEGQESFTTEIDGRPWTQPTFPYQAKCLSWIRQEFAALSDDDRTVAADILNRSGCQGLLA